MLIRSLTSLLLAASTATALKDAYPFVLLSTQEIPSTALQSAQISTAETIQNSLQSTLTGLDANTQYVFIEQGGVHAADLRDGSAMPKMRRRMGEKGYKSVVQVADVLGGVELDRVELRAEQKVEWLRFPTIRREESVEGRRQILGETDAAIDAQLSTLLSNHTSHIIVYASVPFTHEAGDEVAQQQDYKMDEPPFHENLHTDLKRDLEHGLRRRQESDNNDNFQDGLPLFEKYQFLTPGIFMGLSVSILLFGILYVGISAIAGLEVSYMAFSKEMGPQAQQQKKQQ